MASDAVIRGYAEALFLIAQAEGDLDKVEDELYEFATTFESAGALREALTDPGLPVDRKLSVITELLGGRAFTGGERGRGQPKDRCGFHANSSFITRPCTSVRR